MICDISIEHGKTPSLFFTLLDQQCNFREILLQQFIHKTDWFFFIPFFFLTAPEHDKANHVIIKLILINYNIYLLYYIEYKPVKINSGTEKV